MLKMQNNPKTAQPESLCILYSLGILFLTFCNQ